MVYKSLDQICVSDITELGIPTDVSKQLHKLLSEILLKHGKDTVQTWNDISKNLLNPNLPFSLHQLMYYGCYKDFGPDPPAWIPDLQGAISTNVGKILERRGREFLGSKYKNPISNFSDFHEFSVSKPEVYWQMVLDEMNISFSVPPICIFREHPTEEGRLSYPGGQWLPGAFFNSAENCLALNGKRCLDNIAVIWRDEGDDNLPLHQMTLKELQEEVCLVANALYTLGLDKGSAIAIDMPMNVTAVIIYLAIVLAGFVVVSIADSFAAREISTRLTSSNAKAIFTQDFIIRGGKSLPLYSRVVDAESPLAIVVPSRGCSISVELRDDDLAWPTFVERAKYSKSGNIGFTAVGQPIEAFSNILFSSGTTGEPKAIPWTHATPLKAAADAWCHMDVRKGDVVVWPTNLGWMMGPWLVYASLLNGASIALYNGSPLGSGFCKFVQDAKVTMLGVVPSVVRAWKNSNCTYGFDWSAIRCFSSTGEASNADEYLWLMGRAQYKPVIEYCGGTEIGGGFVSGSLLQPQSLAAFSTPAMGCTLYILAEDGNPINYRSAVDILSEPQPHNAPGIGELALDPRMLGASNTLLNAQHHDVYFKGMPIVNGKVLRKHGDEFERTFAGYYKAHGRADDTMNLGGIKISSIEIERICNSVDDTILETAAIGVPTFGGGPERLVIIAVFKDIKNAAPNLNQLRTVFNSSLQQKLNPLFKVSYVMPMAALPRTASNKVMRRVLRQQLVQHNREAKL
ncbi:probable acyl-activating enzyme 17, peroxisomal isoform X2 [Papaver somniferum]|uniref:probable acyl-activating enzyme 17, peroxisomal isoform X2 n=1 Tax=Papaver somniferum TaxID=3469 RepID=UPI000E6FDBB5|nr:probable acyl-activating enzyme 17, peroxisomal isoform X2 [Papaver somniferum]